MQILDETASETQQRGNVLRRAEIMRRDSLFRFRSFQCRGVRALRAQCNEMEELTSNRWRRMRCTREQFMARETRRVEVS